MAQVTNYPILVTAQDFDNLEKVEKINTIVKGQYNSFIEKTTQKKARPIEQKSIVKSFSGLVSNIHGYNYGYYNYISMYMSTQAMIPDAIYPILRIRNGAVPTLNGAEPEITFTGIDGYDATAFMLNSYGVFILTYNRLSQEQQISFRTFTEKELHDNGVSTTIPAKVWYVSMNFFYQITGDINL